MPHQQQLPQQPNPSALFHQGAFYPFPNSPNSNPDSSAYPMSASQYNEMNMNRNMNMNMNMAAHHPYGMNVGMGMGGMNMGVGMGVGMNVGMGVGMNGMNVGMNGMTLPLTPAAMNVNGTRGHPSLGHPRAHMYWNGNANGNGNASVNSASSNGGGASTSASATNTGEWNSNSNTKKKSQSNTSASASKSENKRVNKDKKEKVIDPSHSTDKSAKSILIPPSSSSTSKPESDTNSPNSTNNNNNNNKNVNNNNNTTKNNHNTKKRTNHESDEEAAVTALLMASETQNEDVEIMQMQAAVRKKKARMMKLKKEQYHTQDREREREHEHDRYADMREHEIKVQQRQQQQQQQQHIKREHTSPKSSSSIDKSNSNSYSSPNHRLRVQRTNSGASHTSNNSVTSSSSSSTIPHANIIVKEFPNVLHEVLTKSEYAGTVLEWLPHGKSWRILRWDELSDSVIPCYFPELCIEYGNGAGDKKSTLATERMNLFIRQIKVWGFKEVREVGPDLGSFTHEFFMKIAPNLCRHMKIVRKGTKRPSESKLVSPPRRGPKGRFSMHSSPALNPGFNQHFKKNSRPSHSQSHSPSNNSELSKRKLFTTAAGVVETTAVATTTTTENREEVNVEASSPGTRSGPRCVSFQERLDGDDSSTQSIQRRPPFESPRSHQQVNVHYVSPLTKWVGGGNGDGQKTGPRLGVRSNRGGARVSSRVVEVDEKSYSSPTSSRSGSYPVSNRGRGTRNVSSRGRSHKPGSASVNVPLDNNSISGNNEDPPMILERVKRLAKTVVQQVPITVSDESEKRT